MGNLIGILILYLVFRSIDIATDKNKKAGKKFNNKNKKRLTFEEVAEEFAREIQKAVDGDKQEKTDMKELKSRLKAKHKDKIKNSVVSSDKNIKMRHGENSLEGVSLETNNPKDVCLTDEKELFDRVYTKQIEEFEREREEKRAIVLGEKNLEVDNISTDDLKRGIIFQEILSKPVSLR